MSRMLQLLGRSSSELISLSVLVLLFFINNKKYDELIIIINENNIFL